MTRKPKTPKLRKCANCQHCVTKPGAANYCTRLRCHIQRCAEPSDDMHCFVEAEPTRRNASKSHEDLFLAQVGATSTSEAGELFQGGN